MSVSIADLVGEASRQPKDLSPLDAIMGEDWAHYKAGNPRKAQQIEYLMRQQKKRPSSGGGLVIRVGQRKPQAVVKMIHKGGASDAAGLRAQMAYLRKDDTVVLQRSESHFGVPIDEAEQEMMMSAWGMDVARQGGADRTSHFVVSFPIGTDRDAAARAGRAWAEEMFESGRLGDRYDYYTADHRDTDHPHTHVVVYRRGMEHGDWLKVSRRSELNYDSMRELQVEVAEREGIELEATPRLARGLFERSVPDARLRRGREGREIERPAHSEVSAIAAAATVVSFGRQMEAEARLLDSASPEMQRLFGDLVGALRFGHQIAAQRAIHQGDQTELQALSVSFGEMRQQFIDSLSQLDREVATFPDPVGRVEFERELAIHRREAADLLPEREDLAAYQHVGDETAYRGVRSSVAGALADKLREKSNEAVAEIATGAGLNAHVLQARYGEQDVSLGLSAYWRDLEVEERIQSQRDAGLEVETAEQARDALDEMHKRIERVYRGAEHRLDRLERSRSRERDDDSLGRDLTDNDGFGL